MLAIVGDVHGCFKAMRDNLLDLPEDAIIIQVGDFEYWPHMEKQWKPLPQHVYFVDGNHEYHPALKNITMPTEVWEGLTYVPRGTVMKLDGYIIGFCGGANSIDWQVRTPGIDWFPEEAVTCDDVNKIQVPKLDLLVTHTPPAFMLEKYCDPGLPSVWGLPYGWVDPSSYPIQWLWERYNKPMLYCGHLHRNLTEKNVRVIKTLEYVTLPSKEEE